MLIRVLAAALAGAIVFFGLGFVIYGLLVDPILKGHMNQFPGLMKEPMPDMLPLFGWNFVMALLFAIVFDKWAGIRTFVGGLKGGFILMLLIAIMTDLNFVAFMNVWKDYIGVVIDVICATVLGTVAGGFIGLVLGLINKTPSTAAE